MSDALRLRLYTLANEWDNTGKTTRRKCAAELRKALAYSTNNADDAEELKRRQTAYAEELADQHRETTSQDQTPPSGAH